MIQPLDAAYGCLSRKERIMDDKALFVGIEAKPGQEEDVAELLRDARETVEGEPGTHDWYAMRFGLALFASFDTFPDNAARIKHLLGQVGRKLIASSFSMLDRLPDVRPTHGGGRAGDAHLVCAPPG